MKNENVTLDEAALVLKHTVSFYTGDSEKWARFLKQSAFLYKYDIINQFLIANYSYGKNLTAAASESEWKRLKASVNENAEGIPIVKKNNEGKREISYVYDISDTNSDYKIWQPDKNSTDTVKAVSNYFKASGDNFKAAVDNSILDIAGENFSPTDKDWNDLILNSIKYVVYTRCGLDTAGIALDSLSAIQNFHNVNTTKELNFTLNSLNKNILRPAEKVLRGIERSVIAVDRQKKLTAEKEKTAKVENSNIIGNTAYRYIANKTYRKIESSLTEEISKRLDEENIKFSGKINSDNTTTLTFNRQDLKAVQRIIGQAKNKDRFFTDEEVQAAKAVSLVDYLGYRGENLKRVGSNEYTLPEHDSMRISGSKYYWNSRSKGGNAVDFCMNYYNMTFQEAVKELLDYGGNMTRVQPQAEKKTADNVKDEDPAKLIPFPLSEKTGRVFKYLTESRGLSADTVNSLINEGKIAQDINGNAVFKVFDKNGELNGSEVSGTSQRRYKQTTGLDGNGFTVNPTGTYTPEKAIFFESAIDLLSYYEFHKDETALLISMGGLKDKTVLKAMEDYSLSTENCFVAVDNDEAGTNFTNKMKKEYNINAYPITGDERFNLHKNIKDWNDLLKAEKEDKTEHLTAYHTTNVDFDTFKPGYRGVIWTEKNLDFAKSRMAGMGSDRIFTCDVAMKNPKHITYDSGENWDIDRTIRKARNEGYDGVVIDFKLADDVINNSLFQFVLTRNLEADARDILYSIVKANASDALENETLKNFFDRVKANNYITHSYVAVFKPEQVKITDKILLNEQPEIGSVEQESEAELKKSFQAALQNHETFYIKHTEENFENYRITYDDKENHYNIIADRIYPIAKIRESDIIEESLAADINVDSVIDIIKSYDSEISPDNLKTDEQVQQEKQLAAQAEQTVINNFMKNYINSEDVFCPNLDLGELYSVTNELFYYENSAHNVDEKIAELAAKYRNGEDISTVLSKHLDCETHIKIDADEERYDAELPNDKDLYADIFVEKDENGLTFKFGNTKRFCTWEEYGKGQLDYLKDFFRSRILSEYASEETAPPQFNSYGEELPEPEREMPKEQLDRLLARLDGKELTANLVGEFYEFYGKDAQAAADVLGFKLTHKNINGVSVPMVGFPRFSLEHFRSQLTDEGYVLNINKNPENSKNLSESNDSFSVYQLKDGDETRYYRYISYADLQKSGLSVDNSNYKLVYKAPIEPKTSLENIFFLLNTKLPEDFKGHSLSVSDIIVLHKDGQDKAYYVDSVGFKEVPEFLHQQEISKEAEKNENIENNEKSSIHFGLLGNGITVYDISREKNNDYLTVAHISDEGAVKYYVDDLKETDKELIQKEADRQKAVFTEKWNELSTEKKYDRILAAADTNQLVQITGDMISTEDRVKKYEHSVIFKDEDFPKEFKSSIIGNTTYRYIPKKQYKKISNDSDFTNSAVERIGSLFESAGIKYSGIIRKDFTTITFSKNDIEKVQPIIDSVINQKVEADKKVETIEENTKIEKKAENTDVENTAEKVAPTIMQTDIDSVLSKGSGFQSGKYRIYRQFQKQEKSKVNADFLKKEYGSGNSSHAFSDGVIGWSSFDSKGLSIIKYSNYDNPDVKMSWSQVEKQVKKLISEDRYFTDEDNTKYPEFLKSINAPQYEIDNFIKSVHQKFIQSKSKLPPDEKRDSLALRLSDFIRDLDGYEQGLLKEVGRTDLADISADEMEKQLGEPETVQQLLDFLRNVQGATSDVYSRSNAWYFRQELSQLHSMQYICHTDDIVYIDSSKFKILEAKNNNFILRNVELPLDTRNLSFEELQKQLSGDKSNDIYKRVVTENSADNEQLSPKPSIDVKQMQVGSLDKISNARFITFQSFSQNIIDLFLQQGSNTENARMMIATEFMKQKTEDEIAESLKNIYQGGFGIQAGNRIISAWYDEDGINISSGRTARYKGDAQVVTWDEAADRIGQLLKNGDFASNVELVEAPGFEKRQLAEKIVNLYRDLSDEGSKQNLFSTLKNSGLPVGFPESTDFLNEKLNDSEFRKALSADFDEFKTAYKQNREVLRFHYHKVDSIYRDLKELELPRINFESNMTAVPNINGFITDDEINADLVGGSGFENGKSRIYDFFTEKHTSDEKAAFLRDEYGIGGHSHALSGAFGSWQEHNSKGLLYSKSGCEDVKLNWLQASKRINELIKNKQYISRKEKNVLDEKQIDEQEVNAEQHSKNDINISVPEEKITSFTPIYKNTGKYAAENGETDLFRVSNRENRRCREAIEKTISENFDGMHLDKNAVDKVVEQFGIDRVSYLLAATIKAKKDYDKRFSDSNIKWADAIDTAFRSPDSFSEIINSHSTILDEFTKQFRESIEKERELVKPVKEKAFEDIAEDINKPVEYFTSTVKAVINDLSSISGKRYNVQIWSSTDGKNYTNTGNGRYFNDLDRAKSFAAEIIEGKYDDIIAFTAKYDEIYKELSDNPEKLNEYKVSGEDFDEAVNNDSYNYYLKYISVRGDDFAGDREQTAFVLALNEISRQKNLDIAETQEAKTTVEPEPGQDVENTVSHSENFHITDYDFGVGSPKEKYNRNIEAIKTLFKIESENRQATPEEQEILSKYVGWGGLPEVFDSAKSAWHKEYEEVKSLFSDSEYRAAKSSTLNAHYTTPLVISSIYKVLESAGFTGGKILEPAMGIGNFFGLLPDSMKDSELYGVELDSITGRIAKQLYPNADIQVKGFEKTDFDRGFFDAAVGNVPFGNYRLYDEEFHDGELIHDFFFKKSLDKVCPGGLVAFVTSKGTLDKADTKVREYLAQRADLLGAIRLPNTAFKKNANTEVTADILFLKKRENLRDFEKDGKSEWTETTTTLDGLPINSYFVSHPQMVLGEMKEVTRRYGKETACLPFENKSLDELLEEAVSELGKDIKALDKNDLKNVVTSDTVEKDVITENENVKLKEIVIELNKPVEIEKEPVIEENEPVIEDAEEAKPIAESPKKNIYPLNYRNFCYCNIDGDIYYRENKNMEKQDFSKKHIKNAEDRVKGMIEISGCLQELIRFQKENYEDEYIIKQQEKLNKLYNNFTEKYGLLSDKSNRSLFLNDDTYPLLQSLENINSKGELESKADIFTKRTIVPYVEIDSVDTAAEALAVSISEKAGVDIDFMARLCSKTNDEVINDLEGVIFKNPVTEKYETSDEYLSGNVREKLRTAEIAAKKDSTYNINVSFLKEAQPNDLTPEEISVQLGSTWVPTKYYEQFMYELLDTPDRCQSDRINAYSGDPFKSMGRGANSNIIAIDYNNYSATYAISNKENYKADKQNFKAVETYGTSRINAYKIIEDTLNMKTVKIVDYVEDINGKVKAVPNEKETILAQEKQALIKSKFREWIFDDAERTADLCKIYNEKFNSVRPREYSGKHINFVGMNPEITLKEHQKNAIAHTLYGKNTLLAHSVGAGKTYEMVASAMESKRLGLCTKSLIVVPKHIVNQTAKEFLQLYPAANILVPNENDFTAKNRQKFCSRISTGNYDAIIISHNQFEKIPLSIERQIAFIEEEIDEITKNLEMLKNQRGERGYTVKDLERTRKNLENTLETLNNNKKRDTVVTFEELGVDKLYVDEVQYFKNLFLVSKMGRNVAGINTSSRSQRATDLYMKCQYLDEKTGSKGTVFATGTPLSNSMTELYTMQKYLQQDELKARGLNNFDSWASCFGETQTALELAPEGKGYQMKTRFSRFFNLPELMSFFKETADIKVADELNLPVPKANFHNIATEPSRFQQDMVSDLAVRAKRIRDRQVRPEEDNMLKVTNDGRKLALDQRIANPLLPDDPGSKVNVCIDNVFDIWKNTAEERSTQLIFCDLSTPGGTGFNVYNDIKNKLIDKGIPSEEIAFIHDCKTDKQKQELFTKVNNGEVRVLLGSTSKMGTGTNCQQRLKALHHIDCPYRPSDLQQRNGRIIRQGNSNKEVDIYSYVTKGTFDSYIYQLLENKQKFISQIMTSKSPVRSAEDVDETVLSYSQIKALAAGDPKIKEKMDLDIDLARLRTLFADYQSTKRHLQNDILNKYPADIKQLEQHIEGLEKDIALGELTKDKEFDGITIYDKKYTDKKEAGTALISACQMFPTDAKSREIGEYRGFKAILSFDSFTQGFNLTLKNATSITVPLGQDPYGNFTRLNNAIANFPKEMETHKAALENTMKNLKNAKEELTKPFARIDELHEKEKRLAELNKELTMGNIADTAKTEPENETITKTEETKSKPVKAEYAAAL